MVLMAKEHGLRAFATSGKTLYSLLRKIFYSRR
jgi:hypothetical protein